MSNPLREVQTVACLGSSTTASRGTYKWIDENLATIVHRLQRKAHARVGLSSLAPLGEEPDSCHPVQAIHPFLVPVVLPRLPHPGNDPAAKLRRGRANGWQFHIDGIHLNTEGGHILTGAVSSSCPPDRRRPGGPLRCISPVGRCQCTQVASAKEPLRQHRPKRNDHAVFRRRSHADRSHRRRQPPGPARTPSTRSDEIPVAWTRFQCSAQWIQHPS